MVMNLRRLYVVAHHLLPPAGGGLVLWHFEDVYRKCHRKQSWIFDSHQKLIFGSIIQVFLRNQITLFLWLGYIISLIGLQYFNIYSPIIVDIIRAVKYDIVITMKLNKLKVPNGIFMSFNRLYEDTRSSKIIAVQMKA